MPEQILWPPATIWKSLNLDWKKCNDEGSKQEEKPINGTKNKTRKHTQWRGPVGKKIDIIIHNNPTTAVPPKHETQRWWCTMDERHDEAVHCWCLMRWGHVNTVHQIYQQSSKRHLLTNDETECKDAGSFLPGEAWPWPIVGLFTDDVNTWSSFWAGEGWPWPMMGLDTGYCVHLTSFLTGEGWPWPRMGLVTGYCVHLTSFLTGEGWPWPKMGLAFFHVLSIPGLLFTFLQVLLRWTQQ